MSAGNKCVAKFNYQAADGEELTIGKGETLTLEDDAKGTWWNVRNQQGRTGIVPSNYVDMLPASASSGGSARTNLQINEPPNQYQQPDLMMGTRNGPSLNIRCLAKFKYTSTREDELSLEKGDEVIVMEKEADGWWRGRCGTRIGWFPFNYVEEAPKIEAATAAPLDVQVQLQQQQALPMAGKNKSFVCGVIALYSFNSGNPEELPFEKGDFMDIIDQPPDDPDWWEARKRDGSTGLVPRNYVEVVHDAEPVFGRPGGGFASRHHGMAQAGGLASRSPAPFAREAWFYGKVARRDAEGMLNRFAKNGEFIVRESETKVTQSARHGFQNGGGGAFPFLGGDLHAWTGRKEC